MKKYLLIFSLFIVSLLPAQDKIKSFGSVSAEHHRMTKYDKDPDASAVVLLDYGRSYFIENGGSFEVVYERHTQIKILKEAGVKYADIEIPFYYKGSINEEVYEINAITYNLEDGQLLKSHLDLDNTYTERYNENWKSVKFALPQVKEGSVIEYSYKIKSPYKFNLRDWEFQWSIPVIHSEYQVALIPFYAYTWLLQGANNFGSRKTYESSGLERHYGPFHFKDNISEFIMYDMPAFEDEEFITSKQDYIIKIDFQLSKIITGSGAEINVISTWPEMIKEYLKHDHFGKFIKKAEKEAPELINIEELLSKSESERYNEVLTYVKEKYNWNGSNSKYSDDSFKSFLKEKEGNSADINLLTVGLLRAVEINVDPIIISTRKHGVIKYDYPYAHFFNYAMFTAIIDGEQVIGDATDYYVKNDRIPVKCINDRGLIIKKSDEVQWVKLVSQIPTESHFDYQIDIIENEILLKAESYFTEFKALSFRKKYARDKDEFEKIILEEEDGIIDSTLIIKNLDDALEKLIIEYSTSHAMDEQVNKLFISPFPDAKNKENPFTKNSRRYPIDMVYPKIKSYQSIINIPDGFKLEYVHEKVSIENKMFHLSYISKEVDKQLVIEFKYYFKRAVYPAEAYNTLKFYYEQISKLGSEGVVLIKE